MLIDVHTHKSSEYKSIKSLHFPDEYANLSNATETISVGIHPWWAKIQHIEEFEKLFEQGVSSCVVAIGECGVDRVRGEAIDVQKSIFHRQVQLASKFNLPVIVHQVKGISDVLHEMKQFTNTKFVLHAYFGNAEQTVQLLKHDVYFSFGEGLIKQPEKYQKITDLIPVEKVLFETDDAQTHLRSIYQAYAQLKSREIKEVELIVEKSARRIFNLE
ncbi:MAG: TatD family hydrolase [Salinivirgaceae bacterium]